MAEPCEGTGEVRLPRHSCTPYGVKGVKGASSQVLNDKEASCGATWPVEQLALWLARGATRQAARDADPTAGKAGTTPRTTAA